MEVLQLLTSLGMTIVTTALPRCALQPCDLAKPLPLFCLIVASA